MTSPAARMTIVTMVEQAMAEGARQRQACAIVGLSARTLQRWQRDDATVDQRPMRVQIPANRLDDLERQRILAIANSVEFGSLPPSQIVPRLTDQGLYVASESTFYRVLKEANQSKHRSAARPGKERSKPRALCATTPNQLYSWDITYLPGKVKGTHYYLYMFIDIFSRKIVGWQVYQEESAGLASELIRDICMQEGVRPNQVVLHSDNGTSMKGATMLATLQALGVMPSFSRPAVSNDNPYSEALFKTLKYRPNYPTSRFDSLPRPDAGPANLPAGTTTSIVTVQLVTLRPANGMPARTRNCSDGARRSMRLPEQQTQAVGAGRYAIGRPSERSISTPTEPTRRRANRLIPTGQQSSCLTQHMRQLA